MATFASGSDSVHQSPAAAPDTGGGVVSSARPPLVLIIRDGWGTNPHPDHDAFNAVKKARTPVADALMAEYPWTLIKTSGEDVGLPEGTMGNSEVGHQNIGAGRIVDQESVAITKACRAGLEHNAVIASAITRCKTARRPDGSPARVHLLCIASDAGVHGQLDHLYAAVKAAKALAVADVHLHLISDGRDTGPFTGLEFCRQVEKQCVAIGIGRITSVIGRYYAMDRDNRWERVKTAYDCLRGVGVGAGQSGPVFADVSSAVQAYYDQPTASNLTGDEFITARRIGPAATVAADSIHDGDTVIFVNYRGDRPRELCAAFCFPDDKWAKVKPSPDSGRNGFDRGSKPNTHFVIMTEYWEELLPLVAGVAFPKPPKMKHIAGEWISSLGLRQFRCAETEKYPHVTFFFNDYRDEPFPGEARVNPQSPKVATYDQKPEMSADAVCEAVLARLAAPDCEAFIVVNFANGDMVGHTGVLQAAIASCEKVDACVGRIVQATLARGGALIVTADHGNAEQMFDPATGSPHTAHTTFDVPLILVSPAHKNRRLRGDQDPAGWFKPAIREQRGRLADIVPTALTVMELPQPPEMTGRSLLA
ncbi:MAG: 2,3-bisphosphoglycerate-independent phosphoglycerate mutase [Planctomycetaceae bacterium]|jgi:2,3-bisphosphoglycerate-independent phosphoglycerate mutase|nr:2,3-bisphosphoglycerate-independent phosphoglycerate mutase [Phycisphaerales bacterium]MCE2652061.1 2,3-bisphosphoglycerate-independent phosphoglycerate mutase [Planctomycetaceae bacterium]